jgi:electron transfer flavoprotein beta subunit
MKILVCVSKVPDTTTKITFTDNNTKFNNDKVQWIMNPTDEWYALVKGLELKEKLGGTVTAINVGAAENEAVIRKALAIGADDAVRIDAPETDAYLVAAEIAAYAKAENFDLVILGKETIDYNGFMVGGALAELLDLPYIALVTALDVAGNTATLKREVEGAEETVEVNLPIVIGAQKGIAEARIPNMRGIMAARTKPLKVVPASGAQALTEVKVFEAPAPKKAVRLVSPDNVEELVELLHNEAKVI